MTPELVKRMSKSIELASSLPHDYYKLSKRDIVPINTGMAPILPKAKLPTLHTLRVDQLKAMDEAALEKKKEKSKTPIVSEQEEKNFKIPRLTMLGAVGLVKNKASDPASSFDGPVTSRYKNSRVYKIA